MRVIDLRGSAGQRTGVAIVPLDAHSSDQMGLTKSAVSLAKMFRYTTWFVVNRDRILGWRDVDSQWSVRLDGRDVLSSYATEPSDLSEAGESFLAGLVENWLEDLRAHWKHPPGKVPGEVELGAHGLLEELGTGATSAATP
ncbi:MAG: hypothetical protein IPJ65_14675 [Archangiaceae bacterium]|nr:hypothetical protein [Archangiaceae bacterium]